MTFAFLNEEDGSIIKVDSDHTPLIEFQRDPRFKKLYEQAHIEVITYTRKLLRALYFILSVTIDLFEY